MRDLWRMAVLITITACRADPNAELPVRYANELTESYRRETLRAEAAGEDCRVLLVRAQKPLDDSTVEAIHYGTGGPGAHPDGIRQFADEKRFRAVAYEDTDGRVWAYGIDPDEAARIPRCR